MIPAPLFISPKPFSICPKPVLVLPLHAALVQQGIPQVVPGKYTTGFR